MNRPSVTELALNHQRGVSRLDWSLGLFIARWLGLDSDERNKFGVLNEPGGRHRVEGDMTRSNSFRRGLTAVVVVTLLAGVMGMAASEKAQGRGVTNVVLVHGAWADGSSWAKVIPLLEGRGLRVVAVQLPLTSLADDVATVQRALALVDGPLLLVAHSYGGAVITQAGNDPKVAGLAYVAAFAPAEGQSPFDLATAYPTPVLGQLQQDQFGFLKLTETGVREDFAQDLSESEQTVLAVAQSPTAGAALGAPISNPAWRNKPCWFLIATRDRVVAPALQAVFAQQMNATAVALPTSHVAMLSQPQVVASFIRRAARDVN
jgi:pimeloyl-ACP methyl ester carboxylesterase